MVWSSKDAEARGGGNLNVPLRTVRPASGLVLAMRSRTKLAAATSARRGARIAGRRAPQRQQRSKWNMRSSRRRRSLAEVRSRARRRTQNTQQTFSFSSVLRQMGSRPKVALDRHRLAERGGSTQSGARHIFFLGFFMSHGPDILQCGGDMRGRAPGLRQQLQTTTLLGHLRIRRKGQLLRTRALSLREAWIILLFLRAASP